MQKTTPRGWHVANWSTWGWIETILKLVALSAALLAFEMSNPSAPLTIGGNPELAAVILVGLMTVFTIVPLVIRFRQQEVISMLYAIMSFLGHAGFLIALLRAPLEWTLPILVFSIFMVLGELAKQRFLVTTGYTENGQTPAQMLNFSRGIMGIYVLLAIFILI